MASCVVVRIKTTVRWGKSVCLVYSLSCFRSAAKFGLSFLWEAQTDMTVNQKS